MYFGIEYVDKFFKLVWVKSIVPALYSAIVDVCIVKNLSEAF